MLWTRSVLEYAIRPRALGVALLAGLALGALYDLAMVLR